MRRPRSTVSQSMDYLITGKAPAGTSYQLRKPGGYPGLIGAMFWPIQRSRTQAGAAHGGNVFDHGVAMLRAICEAGKDKQRRIGIMVRSRGLF